MSTRRGRTTHCPTWADLPPSVSGKTGWPWTVGSGQIPASMRDGSSWPRVSIVTPSYNQGQFIEETIRSVLLQGYPDLEYFIIDGGSMDASARVIKKYEPWLTYWVSEDDDGQADGINKGWRRATGHIVAWLNSDDVYLPGTLHAAAMAFDRCPDAAMIYGQLEIIDQRSARTGQIKGRPWDLTDTLLSSENPVPQPSAFLRKSILDRTGYLDPTLNMSMDWDLWLRVSIEGTVQFVPRVWSMYRDHAQAKTSLNSPGFAHDVLPIVKRFVSRSAEFPELRMVQRQALASAHMRVASAELRTANWHKALRHLFMASRLDIRVAAIRQRELMRRILARFGL